MKYTKNTKIHMISLFSIATVLLVPGLLNGSKITGPLPGMSPVLYWLGVVLPLFCGLVSFFGGMLVYRKKAVTLLSKCTLWVGLIAVYFMALLIGGVLQQAASRSVLLSGLILYLSRFLIPVFAAWLLGWKPVMVFAALPAAMQLAHLEYGSDFAAYIILVAVGVLLSVLICTIEPFRLVGGGRLHPVLMLTCAFSDATLMQMIFNAAAIRTVDHAVSIGIVEFLPFVVLSALLHILAIRKK